VDRAGFVSLLSPAGSPHGPTPMTRGGTVSLALLLYLLAAPPAAAQAGSIILVRHAEKVSAAGDSGLSPAGQLRAQALAAALRGFRLDAIIVSQYRRTAETAAPIATEQGLIPLVVRLGGDRTENCGRVVEQLRRLPLGAMALVVGHSNTLSPIIQAWGGPELPDLPDAEYGTLYLLERAPGDSVARLLVASYGAASALPPGADR